MKMDDIIAKLDTRLRRLKSLPDDPPGMKCYGSENEEASVFLSVTPLEKSSAMPFDNPKSVVDGIHKALADDQGIVEVANGTVGERARYVYSIVKTAELPSGVQYCLTMHVDANGEFAAIQGFFSERGATGMRDTMVLEHCVRAGTIGTADMKGWTFDPYDPGRRRGLLMNLSEKAEYDQAFPAHPLSQLRGIVRLLVEGKEQGGAC